MSSSTMVQTSSLEEMAPLFRLCLHARRFQQAQSLLDAIPAEQSAQTHAQLLLAARNLYEGGDPRLALFCLKRADKIQPLPPTQSTFPALLLVDAGHPRAALRILPTNPDDPEIRLLHTFAQCLAEGQIEVALTDAAADIIRRAPTLPSAIALFSPFSFALAARLETDAPPARDLRSAKALAHILMAEWECGRFHPPSLLVGGKFFVAADLLPPILDVLERRYREDAGFADGYAALAFYLWCAGRPADADTCFHLEPSERPRSSPGWLCLATVAALLGHTDQAVRFLHNLISQEPSFFVRPMKAAPHSMTALLLHALGWTKAVEHIDRTLIHHSSWRCRRRLLERVRQPARPIPLPFGQWPNDLPQPDTIP